MGESVAYCPTLEISVSFGRFENDSLAWEKWSTFSPNKYLEEVEKFSVPGSVAQKKAYFEAHYKKLAAKKAEILDQEEKPEEGGHLVSEDLNFGEHNNDSFEESNQDNELSTMASDDHANGLKKDDACNLESQSSVPKESMKESTEKPVSSDYGSTEESSLLSGGSHDIVEQPVGAVTEFECQSLPMEEFKEEFKEKPSNIRSDIPKEIDSVKLESYQLCEYKGALQADSGRRDSSTGRGENRKLEARKIAPKTNPTKKELNSLEIKKKKKPPSAVPDSPQISTSGFSKPRPLSAEGSAHRSSIKKANASYMATNKYPLIGQTKRVSPKSLHMSINMGSTYCNSPSVMPARKSLIMEQMGDKDIVRRAFKAFRNDLNQSRSSIEEKHLAAKQFSLKGLEQKVLVSLTPQKENERMRKASEKTNAPRNQFGTRPDSVSVGSINRGRVEESRAKGVATSVSLGSEMSHLRRKEFFKKSDEKALLASKLKEEAEAEMKKLRQSLCFKAKPMPRFYRAKGMSKAPSEKESLESKATRQTVSHLRMFRASFTA